MSSAKVVLFTSKTFKNSEHPIMIRLIKDRKVSYLSIGGSCSKLLWDKKENLPKKKHPLYKELVILITKKKLEANKLILKLDESGTDYSISEITRELKKNKLNKKSLFTYFDDVIKNLINNDKIGYANVFKSTKNSIKKFLDNKEIEFISIDDHFLRKYDEYLLSNNVSLNSVFVYMRTFKTLINYARKDNLIKKEFNPFIDFDFKKYSRVKTKKRAITKSQMKVIIDLELESGTRLFNSKSYFLFSFYARGINFIDIAYLKWENIKNNRLLYTRKKTNENFSIEITKELKTILDYFKPFNNSKNDFIFPILNENHISAISKDYRIDKVLKMVNADLKIIAEKTGIEENLTTYVARHSYATIMKFNGVSTSLISQSMGHNSEKTTQIYLDDFGNDILDEASRSLI